MWFFTWFFTYIGVAVCSVALTKFFVFLDEGKKRKKRGENF